MQLHRWHAGAALALVAGVLTGCGGGGGDPGAPSQAAGSVRAQAVTQVEPRTQPADAVQDVPRAKRRAVDMNVPRATRVALGPLPQAKEGALDAPGRRQVGAARNVAATESVAATRAQWQWQRTPVGGQVAAISFAAEGAKGLRLGVWVGQLPGSAQLRIYSQAAPGQVFQIAGQEVLQRIDANRAAEGDTAEARTWWTPEFGSDEVTLEVELPPGVAPGALDIAVPRVSHLFADLSLPTADELAQQQKIGESGGCNVDSTCYDSYANQRNAVARMLFTSAGKSYVCSGTLLNDSQGSGTPYFISANHCISTQTEASSMQTDWFYRSPSCNSRTLAGNSVKRYNGASLLYATSSTDTSFMRLNDAPPAGAVFAGWDSSALSAGGLSVVGIHHPQGDLQKISFGNINGYGNCTPTSGNGFSCSLSNSGNFYRVNWSQGVTEGGSSGSAIFRGDYVVGTLYGGSASCSAPSAPDFYGRFDIAFNARLNQWLAPSTPTPNPPPGTGGRTPVYRFFNASTGAHFFSANAAERDYVIANFRSFAYEGVVFYAYANPAAGLSGVHRFYNGSTGAHFYTISQGERDFVIATYPAFRYEGLFWYAQTADGNGAAPMYRFYNRQSGAHFYTISQGERDFVIANYPVFNYEGVAYYAWTN